MIIKRKMIPILCLVACIGLTACGTDAKSNLPDTNETEKSRRTIEKTETTSKAPDISSSSAQNVETDEESKESENSGNSGETAAWAFQIDTVTLDNMPITEEAFKDNVLTVLNVWGTWCPPCVEELPELQEVNERFKDKNVQIVGVLQDGIVDVGIPDNEIIESAKILLTDAGAAYTVILPDETLLTRFIYDMQYYPTTFFLDAKGEVVHTEIGSANANTWERIINEVLEDISK